MQTAGWSDVWHLGLVVFSYQSIELQIFIGLMAALSALMIVEGLRANFFPRRRAEALKPATVTIETEQVIQAMPTRSFAATRPQMTHLPKRSVARTRLQKAPRPAIKRMANTSAGIAAE
ncbi:MAG TPA: hypothetical protein VGT78_13025 [Rhizomicrobium sp.]|nr:hypothetical protein [Rhizomicrobium sp.]